MVSESGARVKDNEELPVQRISWKYKLAMRSLHAKSSEESNAKLFLTFHPREMICSSFNLHKKEIRKMLSSFKMFMLITGNES